MEVESTQKPNWLELPRDITMNILERLDTLEIVTSVCVVCPLWWNICKDPLLWRTIDMITNISLSYSDNEYSSCLEKICRYAVDRSCGHLKDIYIYKFVTDDLLHHIANSTSHLRCIRLEGCNEISSPVFREVVKKQTFLEELDIYHCVYIGTGFFYDIGKYCPLLKSLKFIPCFEAGDKDDSVALAIAKTMPELRRLMLLNNEVTNDGLLAILDGCPLLESLDLCGCLHLDLNESLEKRCIELIKEFRFPDESIDHVDIFFDYIHSVYSKCPIDYVQLYWSHILLTFRMNCRLL